MQKLLTWIDARFPLTKLWKEQWPSTTRRRISISGTTSARWRPVVLVMQIVTGIFLAMNYKPDATKAFESVEYMMRDVIRRLADPLHAFDRGVGVLHRRLPAHVPRFAVRLATGVRASCCGSFGCFIYLALMAEAFFGYLLPWGQMSYWGAQVIVNLFSTVPFIGDGLWQLDPRRLHDLRRDAQPVLRLPCRRRCRLCCWAWLPCT